MTAWDQKRGGAGGARAVQGKGGAREYPEGSG